MQPLPRSNSPALRRKPDWQQSVAKSRVMTNRAVRATTGVVSVPDSHKGCWVPMRLAPDRYAYSDNGISLGMARSAGHPIESGWCREGNRELSPAGAGPKYLQSGGCRGG